MMTSTQVVKMSVSVITISHSRAHIHPDSHTSLTYDMTPGFKPFTVKRDMSWSIAMATTPSPDVKHLECLNVKHPECPEHTSNKKLVVLPHFSRARH